MVDLHVILFVLIPSITGTVARLLIIYALVLESELGSLYLSHL